MAIAESKFFELPMVLYKLERNELVRDGKGLISVEQGDYRGAANAIVNILTDAQLRKKLSAEARESLQPFLNYDIAGAWQKVFYDLEQNLPTSTASIENAENQNFFVQELQQKQFQIQHLLSQQIQK